MQELSFAHFHTPIFFARNNLGDKIDVKAKNKGIRVFLDKIENALVLEAPGFKSYVPMSNVVSYTYMGEQKAEVTAAPAVQVTERAKPGPKPKLTAQVSGPTHHVFADGPGKTRD